MPNLLNFPDRLPDKLVEERPSRISKSETSEFQTGNKQILFGTTPWDVLEIWIYFPDGRIAGHTTLSVTDPAIKLSTSIDNSGAAEFLNVDFGDILRRLNIEQGRYGLVINIFRNEIGSAENKPLTIETISSDRTELRLSARIPDEKTLREIYEFVVPSVPKISAQGLIDQTFGVSLDVQENERISEKLVLMYLNEIFADTEQRITLSNSSSSYKKIIDYLLKEVRSAIIQKIVDDRYNRNIQERDLIIYLNFALDEAITRLKESGEIDNRFEVP
jgi:hypothetical protein